MVKKTEELVEDLVAGDIVKLISGGPSMTIEEIEDEEATCIYFPQINEICWGTLEREHVQLTSLVKQEGEL